MLGTKKIILALMCFLLAGAYFGSTESSAGPKSSNEAMSFDEAPTFFAPTFFAPQRAASAKERASFTHQRAEHQRGSCNDCHRVTPEQVDVVRFPGHTACANCHSFAGEFFKRGVAFCGICHTGPSRTALFDFQQKNEILKNETARLQNISAGNRSLTDFFIDFSHFDHRKSLPADFRAEQIPNIPEGVTKISATGGEILKCTDCHKVIPVPQQGRELTIGKGHSTCFQCHGMRPAEARANFPYMNDCKECHQVGQLQGTSLRDIAAFRHIDHQYDIRSRTKEQYRQTRAPDFLCAECHVGVANAKDLSQIVPPTDENCATCHSGNIGQPDPVESRVLEELRNSRLRPR